MHGSEPDKEVSDLPQPFVPLGVASPRFAFLSLSEISVLECFQKFMDKDIWQLS